MSLISLQIFSFQIQSRGIKCLENDDRIFFRHEKMASQNRASLSEDINLELQAKLIEQQQLEREAIELQEFINNLQHRATELRMLSSSARRSRGVRDRGETMSLEEEIEKNM
ncbi:predicted protein [Histoplasma capsulatum var. duboisii H88]|uniref:Predicted protein n=2 Tax=Ajellomyces capsulatus (strain H88) TaxID=544711 RepID=F0ULP1_AJEC8|nr:predicted protein [Histoplasma capsulatum var. duboisii H88]